MLTKLGRKYLLLFMCKTYVPKNRETSTREVICLLRLFLHIWVGTTKKCGKNCKFRIWKISWAENQNSDKELKFEKSFTDFY